MHRHGLVLVALVGACTKNGPSDGDEALVGCLVDSTEAIADTTATPDGFPASVDDLIAGVVGTFTGTITHPDEGTEDLTITVAQTGDPVVERRSWQDDGSGMELALGTDCSDDVKLPAEVTFTAGTSLAETLAVDVLIDTLAMGELYASVELADLVGDATPYGFDPATMARTTFQVTGMGMDDAWTGALSFQGESPPTGTGDDATVSATNDPWGDYATTRQVSALR